MDCNWEKQLDGLKILLSWTLVLAPMIVAGRMLHQLDVAAKKRKAPVKSLACRFFYTSIPRPATVGVRGEKSWNQRQRKSSSRRWLMLGRNAGLVGHGQDDFGSWNYQGVLAISHFAICLPDGIPWKFRLVDQRSSSG